MPANARLRTRLLAQVLAAGCLLSALAPTPAAAVTGNPPAPFASWLAGLEAGGYAVTQGSAYFLGPTNCDIYVNVFGSCAANNPATPYVVIQPPIREGQFINPAYGLSRQSNDFTAIGPAGIPINEMYRFTDREALVTVVELPPKAAYFGYQTYLFTRDSRYYPVRAGAANAFGPPDPSRRATVASIGNPVNNAIINAASGLLPANGPWSGRIVIVSTSNRTLEAALRERFRAANGGSDAVMFAEPYGADLYTGLEKAADELYTIFRYTIHENDAASQGWLDAVAKRTWVYRVTAPDSLAVQRFPKPVLNPRLANDESALTASRNELRDLVAGWLRRNRNGLVTTISARSSIRMDANDVPRGIAGPDCIEDGRYCIADTLDTEAYRYVNIGALAADDVAFVVGINHTTRRTDNAYYEALGIYDAPRLTGIASIAQSNPTATGFLKGEMTGSAQAALDRLGLTAAASARLRADLADLYVASIARRCDAALPNCIEITPAQVPMRNRMIINQRAYLKPGGFTGANPERLLNPVVIRTR